MPTKARYTTPSDEQMLQAARVFHALGLMRKTIKNPRLTVLHVQTFFAVAAWPGKGPEQYATHLGSLQSQVSRSLLDLGPKDRYGADGTPGSELVDYTKNPVNLRQHAYYLTDRGQALLRQICAILSGDQKAA